METFGLAAAHGRSESRQALHGFGSPLAVPRPNVLFWLPHGIGDAVLASPAVSGLRDAYPDARIELAFFRTASSAVLAAHPGIDAIHVLEPRGAAFLRALVRLRGRFDLVVLPGGLTLWKHRLALRVLAPRAVAGVWPRHLAHPWFSHGVVAERGTHAATLLVEALRRALPLVIAGEPFASVSAEDHRLAAALWSAWGFDERHVLVVATGCEPANPYKRWPLDRFVEVARRFVALHPDWRVWVPLGPGEADHAAAWCSLDPDRVRVTGDLALATVTAALARARLLVANDSGIAHLAATVSLPSVLIFGPTDRALTRPLGERCSVVTSDVCDRQPCFPHYGERFDPAACARGHECLSTIAVEAVLDALERRVALAVLDAHAERPLVSPGRVAPRGSGATAVAAHRSVVASGLV